jgi:hypothetical protein
VSRPSSKRTTHTSPRAWWAQRNASRRGRGTQRTSGVRCRSRRTPRRPRTIAPRERARATDRAGQDLGVGVRVLRAQERVRLRLDECERVHEPGRHSRHAEVGWAAAREPDQADGHSGGLGDPVDLIGVGVEAPPSRPAWAGSVAVGVDRGEPVPLRPEREDLLPLPGAAHPRCGGTPPACLCHAWQP